MTTKPLALTHMSLMRKNSERKSTEWIKQQLTNDASRFIPIWQGDYLFCGTELVQFAAKELNVTTEPLVSHCYFLGVDNLEDAAIFIVDFSPMFIEQEQLIRYLSKYIPPESVAMESKGFRQMVAKLDKHQAANLGYGRALSLWHQSASYCGNCGGKTAVEEAGHSRICIDESCQKQVFPRTDPVVIMLVELEQPGQDNKCLLAGHNQLPENLVSTLAGFVDPGESLEQAVRREVMEEAGIEVGAVEYIASQPWPFPHSVMIGFIAKATTKEINIDPNEISHASWFSAAQVANFSEWGADDENIQMPRKESIARHLIDLWLARN